MDTKLHSIAYIVHYLGWIMYYCMAYVVRMYGVGYLFGTEPPLHAAFMLTEVDVEFSDCAAARLETLTFLSGFAAFRFLNDFKYVLALQMINNLQLLSKCTFFLLKNARAVTLGQRFS